MIELEAGGARAVVSPDDGGRLASLRIDGLELLVPRTEPPLAWGCYPMVPWAGRLAHGRFSWQGREVELPLTLPPHAIHGLCLDIAWAPVQVTTRRCTLATSLEPRWPFGGTATVAYDLGTDTLRATLTVSATREPFPASLGFHPWFARRLARGGALVADAGIRPWSERYERDDLHLPTGARSAVRDATGPWDDCFTKTEPAVLRWPDALELTVTHDGTCVVVFDEPPHAVCVEPQTAPPDALNHPGWASVVQPGRPLALEMRLTWRT